MLIPTICESSEIPHIPLVTRVIKQVARADVYMCAGAIYIFVLGHFLRTNIGAVSKKIAVIQFLGCMIFFCAIYLVSYGIFNRKPIFAHASFGYQQPYTLILAASFFILFKSLFEQTRMSGKTQRIVRYLASIMVYVFIVHGMVIHFFGPYIPHIFWSISPGLEIIKDTTLYFLISVVIAMILNFIITVCKGRLRCD